MENFFRPKTRKNGDPSVVPEIIDTLLETREGKLLKVERIQSWGQATPEGEWYDQPRDEFVLLLRGEAKLLLLLPPNPTPPPSGGEQGEILSMREGDYLVIQAHRKHRVIYTSDDCFWLALHYDNS